jgi:CubicO group peptidase (beta-lactamase class C family)
MYLKKTTIRLRKTTYFALNTFRLDWNTKVHDILGSDYEFIDEYRSKETTLRDLLSHRTGLARLDIGLFSGYPKSLSRKQLSM